MEEERLLTTIEGLIRHGDELHARQVAELEKAVAGLHEVLRDLASAAMKLKEINTRRDSTDVVIIKEVVRRASEVLAYLKPPGH